MNAAVRCLSLCLVFAAGCGQTITISPETAWIQTGDAVQFEAAVNGKATREVGWQVEESEGGTVTEAGLYTGPASPGTFHVRATLLRDAKVTALAEVKVAAKSGGGEEVHVQVTPAFAKVRHGTTLQLSATVTGTDNTGVTWTTSVGSVSDSGVFTAPDTEVPLTATLTATSVPAPSKSATAMITVTGRIGVSVSPSGATVLPGDTQQFAATVTGTTNATVTWTATGGTITDDGLFTASGSEGTYLVTATSAEDGMASASAMVVVSAVSVTLSPHTATLNQGEKLRFAGIVTGTTQTNVTWSATGGTIDADGTFMAGALPGEYTVTATTSTTPPRSATAGVKIRDIEVAVSPTPITLEVSTTKQFHVTVEGTANSAVTWSATGGTISATGIYTAPNAAGIFTVTATSVANPRMSGSATVTVQYAPLVAVSITSPTTTVTVAQGATQQFTAAVSGSKNTNLVWSANGGTISAAGLFTAPKGASAPGAYRVTATSAADPSQSASAEVFVPEVSVIVTPKTASLVAANATGATPTTQRFTAAVSGAKDTGVTWTVVQGAAGGTISAGGTYLAPGVAGTYTVVASSVADPSKKDTATVTVGGLPVVVTVSPKDPVVGLSGQLKFSATVRNAQNSGVVWSVAPGGAGGQIDGLGNYTAPSTGGQDVVTATSAQDASKSDSSTVLICNEGALCVPSNACHLGTIACSATGQSCNDSGGNAPNGRGCGTDLVCNSGSCTSCVEGSTCNAPDPCAAGKTSCRTGTATCANAGPNASKIDGAVCGANIDGVCQGGVCQCNGGKVFAFGDCQTCPSFVVNAVNVNASPSIGEDNACCGRHATAGLGGPCLTIGQAIKNIGGNNWSITVTPDAAGNVSAAESYPIRLSRDVQLQLGLARVKGTAGQPIIVADGAGLKVAIGNGSLGVDSAGQPSGASEAIVVRHSGSDGGITSLIVTDVNIAGVDVGARVDNGGALDIVRGRIEATDVGILCRADSAQQPGARVSGHPYIPRGRIGILAGKSCTMTFGGQIGITPAPGKPCPLPRPVEYGAWVESDASLSGTFVARCAAADGVALRNNPSESINKPNVNLFGSALQYNGCAGLFVETGKATISKSEISNNRLGVYLSSSGASSDPAAAPVNLNSGSAGSRNRIRCNNASRTGGACDTGPFATKGFNVVNNSGYTIDASNNYWTDSPVSKCLCNETLASCSCTGWPVGQTIPPDGLSILNAPLLAGSAGVPSVITFNNAIDAAPTCP